MNQKILIIGTVPYSENGTSRAFSTYFKDFSNMCLAQIYSIEVPPENNFCSSYMQITDKRLLKRRVNHKMSALMKYDGEPRSCQKNWSKKRDSFLLSFLRNHKGPLWHLIRGSIWKSKYWKTNELDEWLSSFKPDIVFCSFSNDFFIMDLSMYVAQKFDIPIITSIGDDYFFDSHFSLSPFYWIYRSRFKKKMRFFLSYRGTQIYIGDKIKDTYNAYFRLSGNTIHLCYSPAFLPNFISKGDEGIIYSGNLTLGRYKNLIEIGKCLAKLGKGPLHIYSGETDMSIIKKLRETKGITFHGKVNYSQLATITKNAKLLIICESFQKKFIPSTRFSLSTKTGDCLISGVPILAYGPIDSGVIGFLQETNSAFICTSPSVLLTTLDKAICDENQRKTRIMNAEALAKKAFDPTNNSRLFDEIVQGVCVNEAGSKNK